MARAFRMGDKPLHLFCWRRACHGQRDGHALKVRWRIVHIIFLSVPKGRTHVGRGVIDWRIIEWREPRQLSEQSESHAHQEELQRGCPLLGTAA